MENEICIIAEASGTSLEPISEELACEAGRLSRKTGWPVRALLVGGEEGLDIDRLIRFGADEIIWLRAEDHERAVPWDFLAPLHSEMSRIFPRLTLAGMTPAMVDLLPPLAVRLDGSLLTHVHFIRLAEGGRVAVTRPFCGGAASVQEEAIEGKPAIVAFPVGVLNVHSGSDGREGTVTEIRVATGHQTHPRRVARIPADPRTVDIADAERIVSAGEGAGGVEAMEALRELADAMGASLAGTRKAVDRGWIPHERQIGQTGKEVKPGLIVACGVSGALAHISRMKDAETIVVINTDRHAPIFRHADFGAVADLKEVVPELLRLIRKVR